jgi:hypothetical protein
VRCGGRELLAAGDDDPVLGFFDDVQCDFLVLGNGALLVLRLSAAVDLRVAQRVGQEQIMAHTVFVVILDVLAEIAFRMLDGAELVFEVERGGDVRRQDVGAAAELAPIEFVPQLAVAALALEILGRARQ